MPAHATFDFTFFMAISFLCTLIIQDHTIGDSLSWDYNLAAEAENSLDPFSPPIIGAIHRTLFMKGCLLSSSMFPLFSSFVSSDNLWPCNDLSMLAVP